MIKLLAALGVVLASALPASALTLADGDYLCNLNDSHARAGYVTIQGDRYAGPSWDDHSPRHSFSQNGDMLTFNGPFGAFDVSSAQLWEDRCYGVYFNVVYLSPSGVGEQLICTLQ